MINIPASCVSSPGICQIVRRLLEHRFPGHSAHAHLVNASRRQLSILSKSPEFANTRTCVFLQRLMSLTHSHKCIASILINCAAVEHLLKFQQISYSLRQSCTQTNTVSHPSLARWAAAARAARATPVRGDGGADSAAATHHRAPDNTVVAPAVQHRNTIVPGNFSTGRNRSLHYTLYMYSFPQYPGQVPRVF